MPRGRCSAAPPCGGPGPRTALLPATVPGGDGARAGVSLIAAPRLAASGAGGAPAGPAPAAYPARSGLRPPDTTWELLQINRNN